MSGQQELSEMGRGDEAMNSAFKRQWRLLQYIAGSEDGATLAELSQKFNVSVKTIRRDLNLLRSIPFSFYEDILPQSHQRRYRYDFFQGIFPLSLTFDELFAMYVGRHLMFPLQGTYFWDAMQTGFAKIKKVLRPSVVEYAERVSPLFYQLNRSGSDYSSFKHEIDTILACMEDHAVVRIQYRSLSSKRVKSYSIHPYNFVYFQGALYVVGWSCKDEQMRFWKINRLKGTERTDEKFAVPTTFNIKQYLAKAFCPFISEQGAVSILVRFKKKVATQIREMAWDSFKKMTTRRDGSLDVVMEAEGGKALIHWLLGFGNDVEVLEPQSFRDEFQAVVSDLLKKYDPDCSRS
ncbi:MAG: WYL domain-containing transcriptional regulator [Planctomycetia bacterium]|nr:WYL domain-containing transcriptional regulator [Planctomycetia bacterium]